MTEAQKPIHRLMVELADGVGTIRKDQRGDKYNFRGIDQVIQAVHPVMMKLGISLTAEVLGYTQVPGPPTKSGMPSIISTVHMRYTFTGPKGDTITTEAVGENLDYQDKGMAGAQSVALRVALLQATTSPTDDRDPDLPKVEPELEMPPMKNENGVKAMVAEALDAEKPALLDWWERVGAAEFEELADANGMMVMSDAYTIVARARIDFSAPFTEPAEPGTSEETTT